MNYLKPEYEYFLTLCETLNISRAAEKLGLFQGGLSKILKKIEKEHKTALFYRQGRGISPTPYAKALEKHIRDMKSISEKSHAQLASSLLEVKGTLKIGAHPTIAAGYLGKLVPHLLEKYDLLDIDWTFAPSRKITNMVMSGDLDIGLAVEPNFYQELVIRKIASEAVWAISMSKNPSSQTVYFNPDMLSVAKTLRPYKKYKQVPVRDYEVLVSMMPHSNAIFLLPESVANRFAHHHVQLKKEKVYNICLLYRADHSRSLAFNTLLKAFKI